MARSASPGWSALFKREYRHSAGSLRGQWERAHRPLTDLLLGLLFMVASVASPFLAPVTPGTVLAVPLGFLLGAFLCLQTD